MFALRAPSAGSHPLQAAMATAPARSGGARRRAVWTDGTGRGKEVPLPSSASGGGQRVLILHNLI